VSARAGVEEGMLARVRRRFRQTERGNDGMEGNRGGSEAELRRALAYAFAEQWMGENAHLTVGVNVRGWWL